jgi:hypothetical protein
MTESNSLECEWKGVLKISVQDPDAMLAWIVENVPQGVIYGIVCTEKGRGMGYDAEISMGDDTHATLIKTFWDKGRD